MVQVLHLMTREADLQTARTAEAIRLANGPGLEITTRTIGPGGYYCNAMQAALALRFGRGKLFDVVHAWDIPSLLAACGAPSAVVFSPSRPPVGSVAWLGAAMVYKNATAIATSLAMKRALVRQKVPAQRCEVILPSVNPSRVPEARNEQVRAALGIASEDRVLLAPGESVRSAGHPLALHTASILHVFDPCYRLLIWGNGPEANLLKRLAHRLNQPSLLIVATQKLDPGVAFETLLGAADIALATSARLAPALPLALCMARGLPIVGGATAALQEFLRDGKTACLVPRLAPRLLAKAVIELFDNPQRATALGRAARVEAFARFSNSNAVASFASLYRRAAGVSPKGGAISSLYVEADSPREAEATIS